MPSPSPHLSKGFSKTVVIVLVVIIGALFAYAYSKIMTLEDRIAVLSSDLASTTAILTQNVTNLSSTTATISQNLTDTKADIAVATSNLSQVQNQVGGVEQTVGNISGAVSTLKKLAATDQELLKKYSKVYFLNENYTPAHLSIVPQAMCYSNKKTEQYLTEALPFLTTLIAASQSAGVHLFVSSAFRSFNTQQALKSEYKVTYGAGTANAFSADQGYSEHQLGTAVDFITGGFNGELSKKFDATPEFKWLSENAYKYGFALSYPKSNTYYVYEPWHWRFVGVKLATHLHDSNLNFYDIDQRDIDTYLVSFFDGS